MQLKNIEKKEPFTTLYYELTWPVGWDQILSFIEVIVQSDFAKGKIDSITVGKVSGAENIDVTDDFKQNGNNIKNTAFSKKEFGYIAIAGYSSIMQVSMRITIWNQLNRFMLQLFKDTSIEKAGEHCYDKYVDSIEISGHVDYEKKHGAQAPNV